MCLRVGGNSWLEDLMVPREHLVLMMFITLVQSTGLLGKVTLDLMMGERD